MPGRKWLLWAMSALLLGCAARSRSHIELTVGKKAAEHRAFTPESAFFEYVELPGERNELKITLASYQAECGRYVPPPRGEAVVNVTVVTPENVKPDVGTFVWAGHQAHGGTVARPARAYALPTARIGHHGYLFPPGGSVRLTRVALSERGRVDGLLAFQFPGDAQRPAMGIKGRFSAGICRAAR